jgi:hypothetical protein
MGSLYLNSILQHRLENVNIFWKKNEISTQKEKVRNNFFSYTLYSFYLVKETYTLQHNAGDGNKN